MERGLRSPRVVPASEDDPQEKIEKSGGEAVHKPSALQKEWRETFMAARVDSYKAGERVRITSTNQEGYIATASGLSVLTVQTDEADVHAVLVYLRETTEFKLVPTSAIHRMDVA